MVAPDLHQRNARRAVGAYFAINGALFGTWVSRIPQVQEDLGLSEGQLGVALLCAAIGLIVAVPPAGAVVAHRGSRVPILVGASIYSLGLPVVAVVDSLIGLAVGLLVLGAGSGILDLAMNSHALTVERAFGRSIMASFHAAFSVGGFAGAAGGSLAAGAGVTPAVHFSIAALILWTASLITHRHLTHDRPEGREGPLFARPTGALVGLGVIAFAVLVSEGAMADWSGIYLRGLLDASPAVAALGFAGFSIAMTIGRLSGDAAATRWGPAAVVRAGALLTGVGLGVALLVPVIPIAIAGFTLAGIGLSCGFPLALAASGRAGAGPQATALAAVTTAGYTGFLVGPPAIGFVADAAGLRLGLALVVGLAAATFALSGRVEPRPAITGAPSGTPF